MSAPIRAAEPVPAVGIEPERVLKLARDVLATEAAAIRALEARLGAAFLAAARALFECRGRVVVTGIGKSGHIARKLLTHVRDVMRTGVALPTVPLTASFADAIVEMSGKGMGMTAVIDQDRRVAGIFTDGDLRRCIPKVRDFSAANVAELMTANPRTIGPDRLAIDCVELMEAPPKVSQLLIVDDERRLVGALHLHDLFRAKVV